MIQHGSLAILILIVGSTDYNIHIYTKIIRK